MNIAGFQLENAAGAWVGSAVLSGGSDVGVLPMVGALLGAAAVGLLFLSTRGTRGSGNRTSRLPDEAVSR